MELQTGTMHSAPVAVAKSLRAEIADAIATLEGTCDKLESELEIVLQDSSSEAVPVEVEPPTGCSAARFQMEHNLERLRRLYTRVNQIRERLDIP